MKRRLARGGCVIMPRFALGGCFVLCILPVTTAVFSHVGQVARLCQDLSGYRFTAVTGSWDL